MGFIDERHVAALRRAVSGSASDGELVTLVGHSLATYRQRGAMTASPGSPEWREIARTFAAVELEILSRTVERDEGDYSGEPRLPILNAPAPHNELADAVSLTGLLDSYLAELKRAGRGHSVSISWPRPIRHLVEFLKHDDATKITRADLARWRDAALEIVSVSTFTSVWLVAVRAVLHSGVDTGTLQTNVAIGLKVRAGRKLVDARQRF